MATPTYESATNTAFTSDVTSHAVDMPATVNAGDLLIVAIGHDPLDTINTPSGWSELEQATESSESAGALFAKDAAGTEGGGTVDFASDTALKAAAVCIRISGWHGTLSDLGSGDWTGLFKSAYAFGDNNNPDPPSATAPWGADDNLFIAITTSGNDNIGTTSGPSGWGNYNNSECNGGSANNRFNCSTATLASTNATEDPGTFDIDGSGVEEWITWTLVIRPAAAGPTVPDTPTQGTGSAGEQPASAVVQDIRDGNKATASGSGTNEYYFDLTAGGNPSLDEPVHLYLNGTRLTRGTAGSLSDHEWDYDDNDSLGFSTVYFRDDSGDPDTTGIELVEIAAYEYISVDNFDADADEVQLRWSTDEATWTELANVAIASDPQVLEIDYGDHLPCRTSIYVQARVIDTDPEPDEESSWTASLNITTSPEPPTNVVATPGDGFVNLQWQNNDGDNSRIHGIRVGGDSPLGLVFNVDPGTTEANDSGVTNGVEQSYRLFAYDTTSGKYSGFDPEVSATPVSAVSILLLMEHYHAA